MILSAFLAYLLSRLPLMDTGAGWALLVMALLYPASAVVVLRRSGSGLLPGLALATLLAYALPLVAGLARLALKLNTRPRQTLGWKTPAEALAAAVATTG